MLRRTPIQELIKQLEDLRDSIPDSDAMYRGGVINSIRLAEGMIEWEREVFNGVMGKLESELRMEFMTTLNLHINK
jgi:hypothetical protein